MTNNISAISDLTERQWEAIDIMAGSRYTMLYGGRRSGKTFALVDKVVMRAVAKKSRHVVGRLRFNHVKRTIWYETLPDVIRKRYPTLIEGTHYRYNKSDFFVEFYNGSTIWIFGLDDKDRMEKVLGTEYSTALLNETSQIGYDGYEMTMSGLAEKSGLPIKFFGDCNPPGKKHWTYKLFIEGVNPADGKAIKNPEQYGNLLMNPSHNRGNIAESYFDILDGMSKRKRDRFRDGLFSSDMEGALWNHQMINSAQLSPEDGDWLPEKLQTIVALDPNVSEGADKETGEFKDDEAGIGVISKDTKSKNTDGRALVEADYSGEYSTKEWAAKAVWAYRRHKADGIVYESNQGGALVKDALRAEDSTVPVFKVWASKGKYARAEPVTVLYENDQVRHVEGLDRLEDEMLEYVPSKSKKSPNRLDWMVWGMTHLFLGEESEETSSFVVR